MDLKSEIKMDRSPLREYTRDYVDEKDEQEYIKDGQNLWEYGLTATITHWKLDLNASVRHDVFDEWITEIFGDPFTVKGRLDTSPSEDLMKEIGTARDIDGILTVHKADFDDREIAVTDLFSFKGVFYKISYVNTDNLFREHNLFLQFGVYKRNTPEFDAGVNQAIINQ